MSLEIILVILISGLIILGGFYFILKSFEKNQSTQIEEDVSKKFQDLTSQIRLNLDNNTQLIQQQMNHLTNQVDKRLNDTHQLSSKQNQNVNERLDQASKVIGDLKMKLGSLEQANQRIYEVGQEIQSLHQILQNPKIRGGVGELLLEKLIKEMLPSNAYEFQYQFKNHEKVDAVIKVEKQLIPIDAKFPIDNFKRYINTEDSKEKDQHQKLFLTDVKKQIQSISKKYILPGENTFDFGIMYIPSEQIYYEIMINEKVNSNQETINDFARKNRIIIVSPNSFYAYLSALMQALRGQKIQENVFEMMGKLRQLVVEVEKINDDFQKIGFHLKNAQKSYENTDKRMNRFNDRLEMIGQLEEAEEEKIKLIS
jgi:DNA recombination protein RmuC